MNLEHYLAKPNKTLKEHTQDLRDELLILNELGYVKSERILSLADKACYWHDFGKVNREFQKRIRLHTNFNMNTEIAHNVLSLYFIKPEEFETNEDYLKVAYAVLTHHDYCKVSEVINDKEELIVELLSDFKEYTQNINARRLKRIFNMVSDVDTIMIKGILHRCDYSASAGIKVEYINDFLDTNMMEMMESWKQKDKNTSWNSLQEYCIEHREDNIIITAQTGMGKTEAGLLWIGDNKGFFILPIKIAINAIYDRVKNSILKNKDFEKKVGLLHSDTLNYYAQLENLEEVTMDEYYSRTRQLSMPLTITTLDQIFDFVFRYPGYEMKLATLSYSKLVIDEIQMYGPDLLAYLTYGINLVNKFGGKVAVLTATLSPFVRDILKEKGFCESVKEAYFTNELKRHNLKVFSKPIDAENICEKYYENIKKGKSNKILVICNTVKKSQEIYEELLKTIDDNQLNILHNKFTKLDRSKKERLIIDFGKTFDDRGAIHKDSGIWVVTSIVEASLDIDFDYVFTELSDLNGLFQRLGRCNRKGKKDVLDYNCFVFTEINKNIIRRGDKGFIDEKIHKLSVEALKNVDGLISEERKIELIEEYFTTENIVKSSYMRDFNDVYDYISRLKPNEVDKNDARLRNILSYSVMPEKVYEENYDMIEMSMKKIKDKSISYQEKIEISNDIRQFTLSVEPYVLKTSKIVNSFNISKYDEIKVIDCNYTALGFQMKKNDRYTFL